MQNILNSIDQDNQSRSPWVLLLLLLVFLFMGTVVFTSIAPFLVVWLFDIGIEELPSLIYSPETFENGKAALMIIQAMTSLGLFVITPLVYAYWVLKIDLKWFFQIPADGLRPTAMVAVILFCFMVVNSVIIEWNQGVVFPESLSWFEDWAQAKESQLEELTTFLTQFSGFSEYLVAVVVIALIPAVGEELLFRGLLQNLFFKSMKNPHVAIWASAIIFGAFHLQFYGVVPRILLGALFGYLYYWSGYLSLAMVGHFINNALTLTILYFSQQDLIDYDPTGDGASPPILVVLIFLLAGSVLLYLFRNLFSVNGDA